MPGVKRCFEPEQEVLFYRDSQELIDLIVYYLVHEDGRHAIVEAGRRRCLNDHSMQNAV